METKYLRRMTFVGLLLALYSAPAFAQGPFLEQGGQVVVEAENFDAQRSARRQVVGCADDASRLCRGECAAVVAEQRHHD